MVVRVVEEVAKMVFFINPKTNLHRANNRIMPPPYIETNKNSIGTICSFKYHYIRPCPFSN
jgi:hypothetical protein